MAENNATEVPNDMEYWQVYGDDYHDYYYYDWEIPLITYLPKPFLLLSMVCSYTTLREVVLCGEGRRGGGRVGGTALNRILMAMAVGDILFSFAYFLGTWPAPPVGAHGVEGKGSVAFCTFQGFLFQWGLGVSILSNSSLSIFYYLVVCRNCNDRYLESVEIWFHSTIWIVASVMAIYPIPLELYNSAGEICWIESDPPDCSGDWCRRGSNAWPHQLVFMMLPYLFLAVSLVIMGLIIRKVRQIENMASRYAGNHVTRSSGVSGSSGVQWASQASGPGSSDQASFGGGNEMKSQANRPVVNRAKSNAVARQAIWYTLAFLVTFLFGVIAAMLEYGFGVYHAALDSIAYSVFMPSAGTFNFIVFSRNRGMKTPEGRILRSAMFCLCCRNPTCGQSFRDRGIAEVESKARDIEDAQAEELAAETEPQPKDYNGDAGHEEAPAGAIPTAATKMETKAVGLNRNDYQEPPAAPPAGNGDTSNTETLAPFTNTAADDIETTKN